MFSYLHKLLTFRPFGIDLHLIEETACFWYFNICILLVLIQLLQQWSDQKQIIMDAVTVWIILFDWISLFPFAYIQMMGSPNWNWVDNVKLDSRC